jgi:hypothetical protein
MVIFPLNPHVAAIQESTEQPAAAIQPSMESISHIFKPPVAKSLMYSVDQFINKFLSQIPLRISSMTKITILTLTFYLQPLFKRVMPLLTIPLPTFRRRIWRFNHLWSPSAAFSNPLWPNLLMYSVDQVMNKFLSQIPLRISSMTKITILTLTFYLRPLFKRVMPLLTIPLPTFRRRLWLGLV